MYVSPINYPSLPTKLNWCFSLLSISSELEGGAKSFQSWILLGHFLDGEFPDPRPSLRGFRSVAIGCHESCTEMMDESNLPVPANLKRLEWFTPRSHRILFPSEKFYSLQDKIPTQISQTSKQLSTFTETSLSYHEKPLGKTGCKMLNTRVSQTWVASMSHLEKPGFHTSQVVITGFLNQQRFSTSTVSWPKAMSSSDEDIEQYLSQASPKLKMFQMKIRSFYGLRCICRVPTCTYVYPSKTA